MINLDSHSDMSVPQNLEVANDSILHKCEVLDNIDIESWIVPLFHMDILKSVCWLHPDWTDQSFEAENHFKVGSLRNVNKLKVTSTSNHYLSEDDYEHESNLSDLHDVSLHVHCLSSQHSHDTTYISMLDNKFRHILNNHSDFVLSIDLDFFSTHDPFVGAFSPEQYALLKKIYEFTPPGSCQIDHINSCVEARRKQLKNLKYFFTAVQKDPIKIDFSNMSEDVEKLVVSLMKNHGKSYDWEWLHEIGRGIDDCPLPHHPSSNLHINNLINNVKSLLVSLPPPKAIFISSSEKFQTSRRVGTGTKRSGRRKR